MILHPGEVYRVAVRLTPTTGFLNNRHYLQTDMVYCGGGTVDNEGHWVGGGVWIYAHSHAAEKGGDCRCKMFFDLPILAIHRIKKGKELQDLNGVESPQDSVVR